MQQVLDPAHPYPELQQGNPAYVYVHCGIPKKLTVRLKDIATRDAVIPASEIQFVRETEFYVDSGPCCY